MKSRQLKPQELINEINQKLEEIDVLSVDCFDTLFWRTVSKPIDIFYKCTNHEIYKKNYITASKRIKAESLARLRAQMRRRTNEISIYEIYEELGLDPDIIKQLIEIEIDTEIQNGYIYEPIYKVIKNAKNKNKKVIIVSGIYYSASQLKRILYSTCPELEMLIDEVYTSYDNNIGKYNGLWKIILHKIRAEPKKILHIGDNFNSDCVAPAALGLISYHLKIEQELAFNAAKQREIASVIANRNSRVNNPILDPFKGIISEINIDSAEKAIGYCLLGPLMLIFGLKINEIIEKIKDKHNKIHPCFLLRDGYLISKVMEQLISDDSKISLLNISRATAIASSIQDNKDIEEILLKYFDINNYQKVFKQIKLSREILRRIETLKKRDKGFDLKDIRELLLEKKVSSSIFANSKNDRVALINHIKKRTGIREGDGILFIDLGYEGTAQRLLHKVIKEDLNAELYGCYLISYDRSNKTGERYGVIDSDTHDNIFMQSILGSRIASFEMLCTQDSPSVVGYKLDGDPIFSTVNYNKQQSEITQRIQQYCLDSVEKWKGKENSFKPNMTKVEYSNYVAAGLSRFNYFPTRAELEVISSYEFDLNLGTELKGKLFDLTAAYHDMCTKGIAQFQDKGNIERISSQFELRAINATYSMASFIMNRHGIDYDFEKISYFGSKVATLFIDGSQENLMHIDTIVTHDGYQYVIIPLIKKRNIGILSGLNMKLIQILEVLQIKQNEIIRASDGLLNMVEFEKIEDNLYRLNKESLIFIDSNYIENDIIAMKIVFRPI